MIFDRTCVETWSIVRYRDDQARPDMFLTTYYLHDIL